MDFKQRAEVAVHPKSKALFECMLRKKSNLALSADLTSMDAIIQLVEKIGNEICLLKTHIDILEDFSIDSAEALMSLADEFDFLIFEDRKFADIGNTVKQQFQGGMYKIAHWADMVNAHILPGPSIIDGLKAGRVCDDTGLLLLAQMSSKDNLLTDAYAKQAVEWAEANPDFVMGFIAQEKMSDNPGLITMTPGVKLSNDVDALGQQYNTPQYAIIEKGSDIVIVGRGIYGEADPASAAREYREAAWQAYLTRVWQA